MATKTTASVPADVAPEPIAAPEPVTASTAPTAPATTNALSVTSLVLGITGILLGQWWISVAAVVFGFIGRAKEPVARLTANWGLVLGFIGVFGGFVLALLGIAAVTPFLLFGAWDLWDL